RELDIPLLELLHKVPAKDTHLRHVVRMALRDHLERWPDLLVIGEERDLPEAVERAMADVCTGVRKVEAAGVLLRHVRKFKQNRDNLLRYVHHIARYGIWETKLLEFAQKNEPNDLVLQADVLREIHKGTQESGGKLSQMGRKWAEELTDKLLASKDGGHIGS